MGGRGSHAALAQAVDVDVVECTGTIWYCLLRMAMAMRQGVAGTRRSRGAGGAESRLRESRAVVEGSTAQEVWVSLRDRIGPLALSQRGSDGRRYFGARR